jgi:hypothetical protein
MDANSRKKPSQLEINDLIAEAVVNAEARRNQAEELLSDEELAAVKGGYTSFGMKVKFPITWGMMKGPDLWRDFQPKSQENIALI